MTVEFSRNKCRVITDAPDDLIEILHNPENGTAIIYVNGRVMGGLGYQDDAPAQHENVECATCGRNDVVSPPGVVPMFCNRHDPNRR